MGALPCCQKTLVRLPSPVLELNNPHVGPSVSCRNSLSLVMEPDSAGQVRLVCTPLITVVDPLHKVLLDPSYYDYQECKCEAGYEARNMYQDGNLHSLVCVVPEVSFAGGGLCINGH